MDCGILRTKSHSSRSFGQNQDATVEKTDSEDESGSSLSVSTCVRCMMGTCSCILYSSVNGSHVYIRVEFMLLLSELLKGSAFMMEHEDRTPAAPQQPG